MDFRHAITLVFESPDLFNHAIIHFQQIFIKSLADEIIAINVQASDTIAKVKSRIQEQVGIPPQRQNLIFAGKPLKDESTLDQYDIQMGSTLHLVQIKGESTTEKVEPHLDKGPRAAHAKQQQNDKVNACKLTCLLWQKR